MVVVVVVVEEEVVAFAGSYIWVALFGVWIPGEATTARADVGDHEESWRSRGKRQRWGDLVLG